MKKDSIPFPFRKYFKAFGWVVAILLFITALTASISSIKFRECSNLYIKVDHDSGLFFVNDEEVLGTINGYCNSDLTGMLLGAIDFTDIEQKIESNPFVQNAEIFTSAKGAIHVDVRQREPLVRVVNNSGVSYYLDANGEKIPASAKFTARVVVVTGNVENTGSTAVVDELMNLCRYISKDEFWKAQFEQIYVTDDGEFDLVPKLGNHIIRFGKADDLGGKFDKLMIFYKEVLKNFDADGFRIINLKYKDQIVCTKNAN